MTLKKFIAHHLKSTFGDPAGCACTETVTCAHCVQANLIAQDHGFRKDDESQKAHIDEILKTGIRKSARLLGINPGAVQKWVKNKQVPDWAIQKFQTLKSL